MLTRKDFKVIAKLTYDKIAYVISYLPAEQKDIVKQLTKDFLNDDLYHLQFENPNFDDYKYLDYILKLCHNEKIYDVVKDVVDNEILKVTE